MERLTEHFGDYIIIKGCKSYYPNEERKRAPATSAIVRLAAYEDTGVLPNEVKVEFHGKWIEEIGYTAPICSECYSPAIETSGHFYFRSEFCPNCGAKMDGGRK